MAFALFEDDAVVARAPFEALEGAHVRVIMIDEASPLARSPFAWTHAGRHFAAHVDISKDWPYSWARQGVLMVHDEGPATHAELNRIMLEAHTEKRVIVCIAIGAHARSVLQPLCDIYGMFCVTAPSPFYKPDDLTKITFGDINVFRSTNEVFTMLGLPTINWSV